MRFSRFGLHLCLLLAILLCVLPSPAMAYVGPGAGLTALGALLAVVGTIFLAIVGFVWYPIKRLLRDHKRNDSRQSESLE